MAFSTDNFSMSGALPSLTQLATGLFAPRAKNPAESAMPYLNQIPATLQKYYDPYAKAGQTSLSDLMSQFRSLVTNPTQKYNEFGSQFTASPSYNFDLQQALNGANQAAAAGGMLGTPAHQTMAASIATNLANKEFSDFMSQIMGLYGIGIEGSQGISKMGYDASNELANSLSNLLLNQGGLAYSGQQNMNQANADRFGNIIGGGLGLVSKFFPVPKV